MQTTDTQWKIINTKIVTRTYSARHGRRLVSVFKAHGREHTAEWHEDGTVTIRVAVTVVS